MNKVWRVAKNEYLNLVRSKAFLVSVFLMPVFSGGAIAVQTLLGDRVDLRDRRDAEVVLRGDGRDDRRAVDAVGRERLEVPRDARAARRVEVRRHESRLLGGNARP